VFIYERKIHTKIKFLIKNTKILKFFSFSKNKTWLRFSSKTDTFLTICKKNWGEGQKTWVVVVVVPFFVYPFFFLFQPNSRATKRALPEASEVRLSASLCSEKQNKIIFLFFQSSRVPPHLH
jgi:hypothetical protein